MAAPRIAAAMFGMRFALLTACNEVELALWARDLICHAADRDNPIRTISKIMNFISCRMF